MRAEVAGDAAAGDVSDAVEVAVTVGLEELFERLVVAGVGFEDGVEEGFFGAVLVGEFFVEEVGVLGHKGART